MLNIDPNIQRIIQKLGNRSSRSPYATDAITAVDHVAGIFSRTANYDKQVRLIKIVTHGLRDTRHVLGREISALNLPDSYDTKAVICCYIECTGILVTLFPDMHSSAKVNIVLESMNSLLQQYIKLYRAASEIKTLQSRIASQKLEKDIDKLKQEIEESTTDVIHHGTLQRTLRLMEQQLENAASINIQFQRISALLSSCEETFSALLNALMHAQAMASAGAMIDVLSEVKFVQENIFTINQESASFEQAISEVMRMSL